jgi:hypothetical protein
MCESALNIFHGLYHVVKAFQTVAHGAKHLTQHSVSGSFWTFADGRVPSSGMHYSTLTNAPMISLQHSNHSDTAVLTSEPLLHPSFAAHAACHSKMIYFVDRFRDIFLTQFTFDQPVCL